MQSVEFVNIEKNPLKNRNLDIFYNPKTFQNDEGDDGEADGETDENSKLFEELFC